MGWGNEGSIAQGLANLLLNLGALSMIPSNPKIVSLEK